MKLRRWEQTTTGFDANLQIVGSDAQGGDAWTGLPIPAAVPATSQGRYTFLLAIAEFGIGETATLVGIRQYLEIAACITNGEDPAQNFPITCVQTTPTWRFVDGNVVWGLRRLRPGNPGFYNTLNADGLQWRMGPSPAQLFETIPGGVILPPYAGAFPGDALEPSLAQFYDIRFPWTSDNAATILHCPIEGPCAIALFASVLQTNPATRLPMPGTPPFSTNTGISREDAFVANFNSCARYSRVGASLIFQQGESGPHVKPNSEKYPRRIQAPDSAIPALPVRVVRGDH